MDRVEQRTRLDPVEGRGHQRAADIGRAEPRMQRALRRDDAADGDRPDRAGRAGIGHHRPLAQGRRGHQRVHRGGDGGGVRLLLGALGRQVHPPGRGPLPGRRAQLGQPGARPGLVGARPRQRGVCHGACRFGRDLRVAARPHPPDRGAGREAHRDQVTAREMVGCGSSPAAIPRTDRPRGNGRGGSTLGLRGPVTHHDDRGQEGPAVDHGVNGTCRRHFDPLPRPHRRGRAPGTDGCRSVKPGRVARPVRAQISRAEAR